MWLVCAIGSAFFAGVTSILGKCGVATTDSTLATALRTIVVLVFAWALVFLTGAAQGIFNLSPTTWVFLILSGLATGGSWLCYFKALQLGNVNQVTPVDKSSVVLTMILAFIFLGEAPYIFGFVGLILIALGTFLMIEKKAVPASSGAFALPHTSNSSTSFAAQGQSSKKSYTWLIYALASAVFAALTSILGKVGIEGVDSNLGTAIRTVVVLCMAWLMVGLTHKANLLKSIDRRELVFIVLSGFATGLSWLCFYRALQTGPASVVVPIDKLSILVSIAFAYIVFHETLSKKATFGLVLLVCGTLLMLV